MPTLPSSLGTPILNGDLVCSNEADVAAVMPSFVTDSTSAPVRDAIQSFIAAMLVRYQLGAQIDAADSDPRRAVDPFLNDLGAERRVFRQPTDGLEVYRARVLGTPSLVTPVAILAAVNAILSPFTTVTAQYFEPSDCWFVGNGTTAWHSFVFNGVSNSTPFYPDRFYESDSVSNGNYFVPGRGPGGAVIMDGINARMFGLRIPDLSAVDSFIPAVYSASVGQGLFVGSSATNTSYIYANSATEADIYQSIITTVDRIRGHGIRWSLFVDPQLKA